MREFEYEKTPMEDGLPSVTLGDIERAITDISYTRIKKSDDSLTTTTICNITLDNGFSIQGSSACVVEEKYDRSIGEEIAYRNALDDVWKCLGYELILKLNTKQ